MHDDQDMSTDHGYFLGDTHPHKKLQHGHSEKVFDKDCKAWMIEWIKWLLEIPYDDTPIVFRQGNPFDKSYDGLQPMEGDDKGVLFIAVPAYGSSSNTYNNDFVIVPPGEWHLFLSPYVIFNSVQEYPSLDNDRLFSMAKRQVDSVYKLEVLLDGLSLECCRVPITANDNAFATIPHERNILGIRRSEMEDGNNRIQIVADGYGCFLNPIDPGLHILTIKGYSPTYSIDTQIQLNFRGPKSNTKR
jgi:hypothetical protein